MKPLIKICGINQLEILNELALYDQINFLGFIFYEKSPRNVSFELLQEVKSFDFKNKRPVCVYVDADRSYIEETSSYFENKASIVTFSSPFLYMVYNVLK